MLGPILGGVFTRQVSWRWCFYINLPFAGVAFVLLVLTLKLNKPKKSTFADLRRTFDFLGLLLVMIGASLLIVGFSFAADHGFDYKPAIALIAVGGAFMVFTIINCLFTSRIAVIPAVGTWPTKLTPAHVQDPHNALLPACVDFPSNGVYSTEQ